MANENEQWLLNGECNKCRRQSYCSNPCTNNKRGTKAMMSALVKSKLNEMTGGAYGEIMKYSEY